MNHPPKSFIFLSQIIGIPVIDRPANIRIGKTVDAIASLKEAYPRLNALVVKSRRHGKKLYIPWENIKSVGENREIFTENAPEILLEEMKLPENEILLRETFWDKQIVDMSGAKVVRVNDLHLLREERNLWVVHVDVGASGLIRRLGWTRWVRLILKAVFSFEFKDRFISWKFVQPIASGMGTDALALKVRHSQLAELHPADLAEIVADLGTEERIAILKSLDTAVATDMFQKLPPRLAVQLSESINHGQLAAMINEMEMDKAIELLSQLSLSRVNLLYSHLPPEKVARIKDSLGLSRRAAASLMSSEFLTARQTETVGAILERIRKDPRKRLAIYYVYLVDDHDALVGVATIRQLLAAAPETVISGIMRKKVIRVREDTPIKRLAETFYKYEFTAVPVVDKQNRILGIVTIKTAYESALGRDREFGEENTR